MVHILVPQYKLVRLTISLPRGIRVDPYESNTHAHDSHRAIEVLERDRWASRDHTHTRLRLTVELLDLGERHMHIARRLQHQARRAHLN